MAEPNATQTGGTSLPNRTQLAGLLLNGIDPSSLHLKIGKYVLKREIAVGGMGTVFEADQEQPRRSVAVKLMRGGLGSPAALRRFEFESQLLARLRHPGIAQVFDAGTHRLADIDVPFYVMEYIPGARSITDYADTHKLTIRQRLELFATVCDAMHYAHQRGIIHRDIKPGNIPIDGDGRAKVIDFGVARALDSDLAPPTQQTEPGRVVGTLQYMSPEQCAADPHDLDARTDVYALGVVLYELLCGRLPYEVSRANLSDAARIIREEAPTKPRQVKPELSDDIETVVLKAMHKERERRYQSAAELGADVRHVVAGEPIEARRDSATYVLKKRASALVAAHKFSMWLLVAGMSFLLAAAIGVVLNRWTTMNLLFERHITSRIQPAGGPRMRNVRMVSLHDGVDLAALGRSMGLDVNARDTMTLRPLHGALMRKLSGSGVRVVVLDLIFRDPTKPLTGTSPATEFAYSSELLEGIRALKRGGCEVVVSAGGKWDVDDDDLPASVYRPIAEETHYGFVTAVLGNDAPWSLDMIVHPVDRYPMPSLALAACAAYWRPERYHWVRIDADSKTLARYARVSYARPDAGRPRQWGEPAESSTDRVRLSSTRIAQDDDFRIGRAKGDWIGCFILHLPADEVLTGATIDYEQVFKASSEELRNWFEGKVVVVGDARTGKDGPYPTPDGRKYSGFVAHAIGIDLSLSSESVLAPLRLNILGIVVRSDIVFAACGTLAGATLTVLAPNPAWRRRAFIAGLLLLLLALSVLTYRYSRVLHDPLTAMIGAVLGSEGTSLVGRASRGRLH